ncbi:MAG: heme lyase CcmF/NrfE family subunit [Rickettsiales bacterium]
MALIFSLLQSLYLLPSKILKETTATVMPISGWLQALFISSSLFILIILRLNSDFSVLNVVEHSNLSLPILYKIVGTWGNHEGSMLLWVFVLAMFGALLINERTELKLYASSIQSLLCAGFLIFILYTSNPFARVFPPTADGRDLNPLLQDIGLAMHPPLLYVGYVGFSVVFSLAAAALIVGMAGRKWAEIAHIWIMVSWSFLTAGIGLGGWWAYRELGWGGWWFWDPVENASLLPWLAGTALFHSNIVLKKRDMLGSWVIILSIITFALSLLGTFLVRSGAITSVHSFASDPQRGIFILIYMFAAVFGALLLYSIRGNKIASSGVMNPLSREGMILINNLFILSACATVLFGTLYPMFAEVVGASKVSVGAPFFNITFIPIMGISLLFAAITPFFAWKKANLKQVVYSMRPATVSVLIATIIILLLFYPLSIVAVCGFALTSWLVVGSISWLAKSQGRKGRYSVFTGHVGAAFILFGITSGMVWKEEGEYMAKTGDVMKIFGYDISYVSDKNIEGSNYSAKRLKLILKEAANNKEVVSLNPEYRIYKTRGSGTSEVDIYYSILGDLYVAAGESAQDGRTAIRIYYQPMIYCVWLGFIMMAVSGIFSIYSIKFGKRY